MAFVPLLLAAEELYLFCDSTAPLRFRPPSRPQCVADVFVRWRSPVREWFVALFSRCPLAVPVSSSGTSLLVPPLFSLFFGDYKDTPAFLQLFGYLPVLFRRSIVP